MTNERQRQRQNVRRRPGKKQSQIEPESGLSPTHSTGADGSTADGADQSGKSASARWLRPALLAAAVAAIGAVAYFGLSGGGDQVTDAEIQSRTEAHQALLASPGLPVTLVRADEVDSALASMPDTVPQQTREEMRSQINQGNLQLAWVTLWDTHVEDGDILRFESSTSIPIEVMALNAHTTFAIPYPADGQVLVTGVKDGGGGITIALESGATLIKWPTMAEGDTLLLPITPGF